MEKKDEKTMEDPVEGKDYKIDTFDNVVWTRNYLVNRGYCCGGWLFALSLYT